MNFKSNKYIVADLLSVGAEKPLGYLPIRTMEEVDGIEYENAVLDTCVEAVNDGNKFILFKEEECDVCSGALYVYNEEGLLKMISEHKSVLEEAKVPYHSCEAYINYISTTTVFKEVYPDAYRVIGMTFNDKRFS